MRLTLFILKIAKPNCDNDFNSILNFEITDDLKMDSVNNLIMASEIL